MAHYVRNAACFASLILCLATVVLWVRSCRNIDSLFEAWVDRPRRIVHLHKVASGGASIYYHREDEQVAVGSFRDEHYPADKYFRGWRWSSKSTPGPVQFDIGTPHQRLGFDWQSYRNYPLGAAVWLRVDYVRVPHWLPAALFAIVPAVWAAGRLRRVYRLRRGLCPACGYDLRASSGTCPECGRPVGAAAGAGGRSAAGA